LQEVYGFQQVSYAAKLKESVAALLDIPVDQVEHYKEIDASLAFLGRPISFRVFLQRYGTEAHRSVFGTDFGVDQLFTKGVHTFAGKAVCITDARFENELYAVHQAGGFNVRIIRPGVVSDGHASEKEPPAHLIDHTIYNDGSMLDFRTDISRMIDELMDLERDNG
jgi:hypothetical protein